MLEKLEYYFTYFYRQYRDKISISLSLYNGKASLLLNNYIITATIENDILGIDIIDKDIVKIIKTYDIIYDEHFNSNINYVMDEIELFLDGVQNERN